ncbi:hypothetical protein PAXRUDRAFT_561378 [Paxillus rubicundulus Ve08.2h10]|uniref:Uncharacterized protein n=1 Tax=Paxillus rubicundulus Ve08.2h10 TaxID=930991 RepID=A0A0D0E5C3_9AGAM|nr:hypothetical protein PAXRUDRAFT_561378 [Paxillus rubicundulus Ve08.2h10]
MRSKQKIGNVKAFGPAMDMEVVARCLGINFELLEESEKHVSTSSEEARLQESGKCLALHDSDVPGLIHDCSLDEVLDCIEESNRMESAAIQEDSLWLRPWGKIIFLGCLLHAIRTIPSSIVERRAFRSGVHDSVAPQACWHILWLVKANEQ